MPGQKAPTCFTNSTNLPDLIAWNISHTKVTLNTHVYMTPKQRQFNELISKLCKY